MCMDDKVEVIHKYYRDWRFYPLVLAALVSFLVALLSLIKFEPENITGTAIWALLFLGFYANVSQLMQGKTLEPKPLQILSTFLSLVVSAFGIYLIAVLIKAFLGL